MKFIVFFLVLAVYLLLPIYLYRRPNKYMGRFCFQMWVSEHARQFFCMNTLLAVIYMHFAYSNVFGLEMGLMVSTVILIAMFCKKWVDRFFTEMNSHKYYLFILMCVTLVMMFIPHLFPLSITLAILIVGVCFYPIKRIVCDGVERLHDKYMKAKQSSDYKELVDEYFDDTKADGESSELVHTQFLWMKHIINKVYSTLSHHKTTHYPNEYKQ